MMKERRRAPRVTERLPLQITLPTQAVTTATHNLSSSGLYCDVTEPVPVMTRVALRIDLPARSIQCEGVVVRQDIVPGDGCSAHRIAIFFTRIRSSDRQTLARFVAERLSAQPSGVHRGTRGRTLPGACVLIAALLPIVGCSSPWLMVRGSKARALIANLSTTETSPDQSYTFRWLRRQLMDSASLSRFDGVIVDLQGRTIEPLRQQDGHHIVRLRPRAKETSAPQEGLKLPVKDLAALQAVVQRYHFASQVVTDPAGRAQLVVYAPVATRVLVSRGPDAQELYVDIQQLVGPVQRYPVAAMGGTVGMQ